MNYWKQYSDDEDLMDRLNMSIERIESIKKEEIVKPPFLKYFYSVSDFILTVYRSIIVNIDNLESKSIDELKEINDVLYSDIYVENYDQSFANPEYAVNELGLEYGQLLSYLYKEIRGIIQYSYQGRVLELVIHLELFLEIYNMFEEEVPTVQAIKESLYYFASDYLDVTIDYRIKELLDVNLNFATDIVMNSDLNDDRYLYKYGEYIGENELETLHYLNSLDSQDIEDMARTFTNGFIEGFKINSKVPLSTKDRVNIRYFIGQEPIVRAALRQFEELKIKPLIFPYAMGRVNQRLTGKCGYESIGPNRQYEYDHRMDDSIFLDKNYVVRKLNMLQNAYETRKDIAKLYAGPAVIEIFGEKPFTPLNKKEALVLSKKQQELSVYYQSESSKILNEYIKRDSMSYTIIAYPIPDIGANYREIYNEIVKINNLSSDKYKKIQQGIIDELDKGVKVRVIGANDNKTDITVMLHNLDNPATETNFENCTADVNIPVGEVFTSPKLTGTEGVLNVSEVYLDDLLYKNLTIYFKDGMVESYNCDNYENANDNQKYIKENLLYNRDTLPIGEFAIGTNTLAYVIANKYDIVYKLPILIVEKMGPHFAIGDTCYSYSEDVKLYNPDGKEIIAKENECSALRHKDPTKAYFNCHTDITIPYDEIKLIQVIHEDGSTVDIIRDGRFVLEKALELNKPFDIQKNN